MEYLLFSDKNKQNSQAIRRHGRNLNTYCWVKEAILKRLPVFFQIPKMYNTKRQSNVNYEFWVMMACQYRFINFHKGIILVWRLCMCREESVWETSVASPFCSKPKTDLTNKLYLKKMNRLSVSTDGGMKWKWVTRTESTWCCLTHQKMQWELQACWRLWWWHWCCWQRWSVLAWGLLLGVVPWGVNSETDYWKGSLSRSVPRINICGGSKSSRIRQMKLDLSRVIIPQPIPQELWSWDGPQICPDLRPQSPNVCRCVTLGEVGMCGWGKFLERTDRS